MRSGAAGRWNHVGDFGTDADERPTDSRGALANSAARCLVNRVGAAKRCSLLATLVLASACSQLLDIEEAQVDPTLATAPVTSAGRAQAGASTMPSAEGGQR